MIDLILVLLHTIFWAIVVWLLIKFDIDNRREKRMKTEWFRNRKEKRIAQEIKKTEWFRIVFGEYIGDNLN